MAEVINNLRRWKTAALAWYVDNLDDVDGGQKHYGDNSTVKSTDIAKYLNSESAPGYSLYNSDTSNVSTAGTWFITYDSSDLNDNVAGKLNARRESVGIAGTATSKDYGTATNAIAAGSNKKVYMFVR